MSIFRKHTFSRTFLIATLLIVASIFQAHIGTTLATKEELDERILSPPNKSEENENEETSNFFSDGEGNEEDRWHFPCIYLPPSYYESILSPNMQHDDGDGGRYENYIKRSFQPWGGKRSKFQPWGGKRSKFIDYFHRMSNLKRDHAVGGSRPQKTDVPTARRSTFNPWGG